MTILKSKTEDIDAIFKIYDQATAYQKTVTKKSWKGFERALVEKEIEIGDFFRIFPSCSTKITMLYRTFARVKLLCPSKRVFCPLKNAVYLVV